MNSVGSKGDSYDNALAETIIGLYKTELIRRRGPWKGSTTSSTGSIRTVVRGNVVFLHPLRPGDHVIEAEVLFANGDHYTATYTIHVG